MYSGLWKQPFSAISLPVSVVSIETSILKANLRKSLWKIRLTSRKMHSSLRKEAYTAISFSFQLKPQFRGKTLKKTYGTRG